MGKGKLAKFAENKSFPNYLEYTYRDLPAKHPLFGNWSRVFFQNTHPICLEVGCGKGEYTTGLAQRFPDKNFIGSDIKGARIWRGLKSSDEKKLANVAFIRSRIEFLNQVFDTNEIDEIWITFPDPQPKKERKRLTAPRYLELYGSFLKPGGSIHVKTDSPLFYTFTLEVIHNGRHILVYDHPDVSKQDDNLYLKEIRTFYEKMWLREGKTIKHIEFQLNHD